LGQGSNSTVFSITHDGVSYAVRAGDPAYGTDLHLAAAILGKDIPHLEQIVAASYEDGVTVAKIIPGKEVGKITIDMIKQIPNTQLSELIDTLIAASKRGIRLDPKASNFIYDRNSGFGIVDYQLATSTDNLGTMVGQISTVIGNSGYSGPEITADDYLNNLTLRKAQFDVLKRYRAIVESKLTDTDLQIALKNIDLRIQISQEVINNYSNPQWVEEQITQRTTTEQLARQNISHVIINPSGGFMAELDTVN